MERIELSIEIAAPPETVWEYLTRADKVPQWFDGLHADMEEGKDWKMLHEQSGVNMWGRVLKADAPKHLVYTFNHDWLKHETRVEWHLNPSEKEAGGTVLTLIHTGWEGADEKERQIRDHTDGWTKHLQSLKDVAEGEGD